MGKVVGIDLGTTNSLVAYVKDGAPVVIRDDSGDGLVPSVVSFAADGTVYVGREAQRRLLTDPRRTVYSVKRFMGRGIEDVSGEANLLPFPASAARPAGRPHRRRRAELTPPEISAFVLSELKRRAEEHFREEGEFDFEVDRAVITVPAYFNDAQRTRPPATPAGWPGSRCCGSSTSRPPRRWPTGWTSATTAPSRSTTWAAAPSTSRSCASRTASSRCWPPAATRTWAATTSTWR